MTSVNLEVWVLAISISGTQEMHRPMLPGSQGDDHHRITKKQSTRHLWRSILCMSISYCICITITKSETLYLKFSQISLSSESYCSKSSSGPMEILSATIFWFQIIKIRNPKDRVRPSSPLGLRPHLSTPTTGFEPATSRFITECTTAVLHGLVCVFLF